MAKMQRNKVKSGPGAAKFFVWDSGKTGRVWQRAVFGNLRGGDPTS